MKRDALPGIVAVAVALLLIVIGISSGVASPKKVDNIVLSPLFWPTVLSWVLLLAGVALIARAVFLLRTGNYSLPMADGGVSWAGVLRLVAFGALLAGYVVAIPWAGMTASSAVVIALMIVGARSRYWKAGIITAVFLPFVLYGFFTHVAGVPIPQADPSRLF